mgnify:CR=1 FL=1
MKTLYESIFDEENIVNNMEVNAKQMRIINWFVEHDLDNWGYEFWKNVIDFNTDGTIDILMNSDKVTNYFRINNINVKKLLLNFDKCYPDFIKVNTFCGDILMDVTKADTLDLKWFAKQVLIPSSIRLVCEDTRKLIIPNSIKFQQDIQYTCILNIYSDKLSDIYFNTRSCPEEISFVCKNLENIDFKYPPKCASMWVKSELVDELNKLNNGPNFDIEVIPLRRNQLESKPKYIGH